MTSNKYTKYNNKVSRCQYEGQNWNTIQFVLDKHLLYDKSVQHDWIQSTSNVHFFGLFPSWAACRSSREEGRWGMAPTLWNSLSLIIYINKAVIRCSIWITMATVLLISLSHIFIGPLNNWPYGLILGKASWRQDIPSQNILKSRMSTQCQFKTNLWNLGTSVKRPRFSRYSSLCALPQGQLIVEGF